MKEILIAIGKVVFPSLYRAGLKDAQARLTAAKAEREELELRVRRGELVEKRAVNDRFGPPESVTYEELAQILGISEHRARHLATEKIFERLGFGRLHLERSVQAYVQHLIELTKARLERSSTEGGKQ